jgi:hypothetical protein
MVAQMLSLAEMEKREALRLCQINTMKKIGTIKDNDGKVIAKSTQTTVCLELEKQYLLDKKNHSRNFPSSRNQKPTKGEKNYDIGHFEFPIAKFAVFTKESFGQIGSLCGVFKE